LEEEALCKIINGKKFQAANMGRHLKKGTWIWVTKKMADNRGWNWSRTREAISRHYRDVYSDKVEIEGGGD
jgi:hypothetical protein